MKYYQSLREKILDGYGRRCACCGEDTVTFLALDHVGGGGAKHRKEKQNNGRIYLEVIKAGFPVKYRLLCHNCNFAVSIMSACPHSTNEYGVGAC